MNRVKMSSKFQIIIPKDIREKAGLKAGTFFEIIQYGDRIELIPLNSIKKLNGFLKGIDTSIGRHSV